MAVFCCHACCRKYVIWEEEKVKVEQVNIRDPYVVLFEGKYYLYGTRSATCWGVADGFDCYVSSDLKEWEGPIEIFHRPEGFFADQNYWAPECVYYRGAFYLLTTLGGADRNKGIYVLRSERPTGPFEVYSACLTPEDWVCIDGTLYFEDGEPVLIFSYSFESSPDGDMYMLRLTEDLKGPAAAPEKLFSAGEASWAKPVPFAKAEFGIEGDCYFTDGPNVISMENGTLYMTWSSWGTCGYAVGVAKSLSGKMRGPWIQLDEPLWPENGGHGMTFKNAAGELIFTLHYPNDKFKEHPVFYKVVESEDGLKLVK